jgi:beta-mannanase
MGDPQARHPLWGVYIPDAPQNPHVLNDFESMVGARPDIVHWYQSWATNGADLDAGLPFDADALDEVNARGAIPMVTWEAWGSIHGQRPAQLASIPTGAYDTYIDGVARDLKAFGKPVFLRPFHEMNNAVYPWSVGQSGNTADDLMRAWGYMHDRFTRIGATNVLWVWSPNAENDALPFADIYPGDQYVDWLAVDAYNGGAQLPWGGWLMPRQLFRRSYLSLTKLSTDKPIMIAETASVDQSGARANWIAELYNGVPSLYSRVDAIVWFQADTTSRGEADWRILQTTPDSLAAFKTAIRD